MVSHLCIPDSHAKHGVSNRRFTWLGKLIADRKPDVIVNIGDWYDMESLSSYDKGKKSFEGRAYKKDIGAGIDALVRVDQEIILGNATNKKNKKKLYSPRKVSLIGNHEERIERAVNNNRELEGTIGYHDFMFEEFGWEVIPYLKPITIDGVTYSHFFPSGVNGKPVSGETPALKLIRTQLTTCVQGHVHTRDYAERTGSDGKRVSGLVVGCFLDSTQYESYAGEANKMWWRGLVILNDVHDGMFEPEFISIKMLEEKYG